MKRLFLGLCLLGSLLSTMPRLALAQNHFSTDAGRIILYSKDGELHFTSPAIYAGIYVEDRIVSLRCKASTFLEGASSNPDASLFSSLFNLGGSPALELAGKLPENFQWTNKGGEQRTTLSGYLTIGGVRRKVNLPITLSRQQDKIWYSLDATLQYDSWAMPVPAEQKDRLLGTFRLKLSNKL